MMCVFSCVDLTPVNVTASVLGPSRVLVQWKPPMGADSSIKYKVYQRYIQCKIECSLSGQHAKARPRGSHLLIIYLKTLGEYFYLGAIMM